MWWTKAVGQHVRRMICVDYDEKASRKEELSRREQVQWIESENSVMSREQQ